MVQYLYDRDIILYTYAGLCGLGLFLRLIVNMVYKHLVKQSEDLSKAKNKMLRYIKMKFEACYRLKIGVNNVDTFVDKNVLRYRFCGALLSTWENLCGQVLFLNLLIVPISAVFGVIYNCGQGTILFTGAVGISSSAILVIVDKSINLSNKKTLFRINLLDYLENFCKVRLEQEASSPELVEQNRREYLQVLDINSVDDNAKQETKDELNRRREARRQKEEERKQQALKREEEMRRAELERKEEEKRKLEERKQMAARRREEERLKAEEERKALEARRAELKRKAQEMQYVNEKKQQEEKNKIEPETPGIVEVEESKQEEKELLQSGLEEIAADKEKSDKNIVSKGKSYTTTLQEEKLIEDVLKEFFS